MLKIRMQNLLLAVLLPFCIAGLFGNSYAESTIVLKPHESSNLCMSINQSTTKHATQGCCSHHQGVCGCSGGRAVCCDGQYSPSCGCNSDSIKQLLLKETPKS